jgi:O-antigen ligase
VNQESSAGTQDGQSRREKAVRVAFAAAFLFALVFLAAWPWEIFQRILGGLTLALVASAFILGFGLIRGAALFPRRIGLPKGMGLPIALVAFACLQSALHSADPAASKALLTKYVWYLLLFGMAAPLFSRPGNTVLAWRVFAVSAGLVGVYAVCCAAGWFTPVLAGTHEYFGRRLTEDLRTGAFVRIAATTPDYNQAILPMLLALPFLLVWAGTTGLRRVGRIAAAVLTLFVVAGVTVSFSRSGLLAVVAVFASGMLLMVRNGIKATPPKPSPCHIDGVETTSPGRLSPTTPFKGGLKNSRWVLLVLGLVVTVLCLLVLLAAGGYAEMLVRRALRGFNSPDPSYRSRLYVFGLAFQLLPKYALFGCGIGASGATLGAVAEPGKWMGTAIHSMPLMMWFETGILGLIGYFWLWWKLVRRVWVGLVHSEEEEQRALGFATLGAAGVLFWMTAIQPFQELSLFPVLAALIIGPTRGDKSTDAPTSPTGSRAWRVAFVCAMVMVAGLVTNNILTYQNTVGKPVSWYASALEDGLAAEQRGDWETACDAYRRAYHLALQPPFLLSIFGNRMQYLPYYEEAFDAADLEFIFLRMPGRGGRADLPCEVAGFGVARCLWNAGQTEPALKRLQDNSLRTCWPECAYAAAEIYWQQGQYDTALKAWNDAARLNRERKPFPPLEYPFDVAPSMDDIYQKLDAEAQALAGSAAPSDIARRAAALLRLGLREEALAAVQAGPTDAPDLAKLRAVLLSVER